MNQVGETGRTIERFTLVGESLPTNPKAYRLFWLTGAAPALYGCFTAGAWVKIADGTGGGGLAGTIASGQIAFGSGTDTIGGSADFIFGSEDGSSFIELIGSLGVNGHASVGALVTEDGGNASAAFFVASDNFFNNTISIVTLELAAAIHGTGAQNATALLIQDVVDATNNFAFKSGAGMVEVGDATKAAGIHVQGVGAFSVDGSTALLWLDEDSNSSEILAMTNRTAGLSLGTYFDISDGGDFRIAAGGFAGQMGYNVGGNRWFFGTSLQVTEWISTLRNTAPADEDIAANELADWFDSTNGAAFAMFKSKTANGTVVAAGFGMNTVSAPSPSTIVLPTSVYGGSAQLLGGPTAWKSEIINGTTYKIPLY